MNELLKQLKGGMIVSCQAEGDDPFNANPEYMALFAKAAEMAGEAEEASKSFNGSQKNAFTMLGVTVSWTDEFSMVRRYMKQLVDLCQKDNMPRSILHKLMNLNDMRKRGEIRYLWNAAYFLKRFAEGKTDNVKAFCGKLKTELADSRKFELIALAARWAELELR